MMDNEMPDAQERPREMSTKEIARAAVEDEFRQRNSRKRGRGGGGGSSSSEDDDSDQDAETNDKEDNRNSKAQKRNRASESDSLEKASLEVYRDRAKERREGKNDEYEVTMALLKGVAGAEDDSADKVAMSKYLGGDEAHTHLVKGLDMRLAQKIKREMGRGVGNSDQNTDDLDVVLQQARQRHLSPSHSEMKLVNDSHEAIKFLQHIDPKTLSSELGQDVLGYLRRMYLPSKHSERHLPGTSAAGLAIQRATLTCAAHGHPHDWSHTWEMPRENMHAASTDERASFETTPLQNAMLDKIKSALCEKNSLSRSLQEKDGPIETVTKFGIDAAAGAKDDRDSDVDIFEDVGDYVPASVPNKTSAGAQANYIQPTTTTTTKGSIFEGLTIANGTEDVQRATDTAHGESHRKKKSKVGHRSQIIDRDLLGTRSKDGFKLTAAAGFSLSSYSGGYGEEMDVDFDGNLGDEDDGKYKKDGGKDETKRP